MNPDPDTTLRLNIQKLVRMGYIYDGTTQSANDPERIIHRFLVPKTMARSRHDPIYVHLGAWAIAKEVALYEA